MVQLMIYEEGVLTQHWPLPGSYPETQGSNQYTTTAADTLPKGI